MQAEAESIRPAVRARKEQRYTPELKARIVAYVRPRRDEGMRQSAVAEEVGVKWATLGR